MQKTPLDRNVGFARLSSIWSEADFSGDAFRVLIAVAAMRCPSSGEWHGEPSDLATITGLSLGTVNAALEELLVSKSFFGRITRRGNCSEIDIYLADPVASAHGPMPAFTWGDFVDAVMAYEAGFDPGSP